MLKIMRSHKESLVLLVNRIKFMLFFKHTPRRFEYCNAKHIRLIKNDHSSIETSKKFLVFIRCGRAHKLKNDGSIPNFDIAVNFYLKPDTTNFSEYSYVFSGGLNKYRAAKEFMEKYALPEYSGYFYMDDDLEISYSELSAFFECCHQRKFELAQPSLTSTSFFSHEFLLHKLGHIYREVPFVEVMCPYFSKRLHPRALETFDLSYSTWGLDILWARTLGVTPIVVDDFQIQHSKPIEPNGSFYLYMRSIGVSPRKELARLLKTGHTQDLT